MHLVISRHEIAFSMHGVSDFTWMVSETFNMQIRAAADRPDLHLPEILIEQVEAIGEGDASLRPLFDVLWQSFGLPGVRRQMPVDTEPLAPSRLASASSRCACP